MILRAKDFIGYGFLSGSLAFIGLPLYVYLPKFYTQELGVSLSFISIILLLSRIIDALQDPLIGWLSDRIQLDNRRYFLIAIFSPLIMITFYGLLFPPTWWRVEFWICIFLVLTYTSYSFISINYTSLAPEITHDYNTQTKLVSVREAIGLLGISMGSILPTILLTNYTIDIAHTILWVTFSGFLILGVLSLIFASPRPRLVIQSKLNVFESFNSVRKEKKVINLFSIYVFSTIAASIPAATVLFYIEDVIGEKNSFGIYLSLYFLSAIFAIPFWYYLSTKIGKRRSWVLGMVLTMLAFMWAGFLGPGDKSAYLIICVVTGVAVAADLTMPVSMLADILPRDSSTAKFFGIWTMLGKSSIALAGSLALFTLSQLGYDPTNSQSSVADIKSLQIIYALVPCGFKFIALLLLINSSLDIQKKVT